MIWVLVVLALLLFSKFFFAVLVKFPIALIALLVIAFGANAALELGASPTTLLVGCVVGAAILAK